MLVALQGVSNVFFCLLDEMQPTGAPWKMPEERELTSVEKTEINRIYHANRYDKLEETIGYKFKNRRLLIEVRIFGQ